MKKLLLITAILILIKVCNAQLNFIDNGQQINNFEGRGVALGDFNVDGVIDAFVANNNVANNLMVYINDGKGQFTHNGQNLITPDSWWGTPAIGDINNDGISEVITGKTVWINDGNGEFTSDINLIDYSDQEDLAVCKLSDLNHDGYLDMFAIADYAASRVLLNDSTGHMVNSGQRLGDGEIGNGQIAEIALGDINNDGNIDAITVGWKWQSTETPNTVWLNDGSGNFQKDSGHNLDIGSSHIHGLTLGDLNNDGWLDLVMGIQDASRSGRVYLNDGTGKFITGTNLGMSNGEKVVLEDFDKDDDLDIFIATVFSSNGKIWLNDGKGNFQANNLNFGKAWDVATDDLNNDDRPDLFTVGFNWNGSSATPQPAKIWLNNTFVCDYFGQTPPGETPEIFAQGIISLDNRNDVCITISPDGREVYYGTNNGVFFKEYKNNSWSDEQAASFTGTNPNFSADGNKIYFTKWSADYSTSEFWLTRRNSEGWSTPEILPAPYNSNNKAGTMSETMDGFIYFGSDNKIWQTLAIDSLPTEATKLEFLGDAEDPSIASDGSYLVFSTVRNGIIGDEDLYVTFKKANEEWTEPININTAGANINVESHSCIYPFLSPDGKYLFYNFHNWTGLMPDIYWVSTSIITNLKEIALSTSVKESERTQIQIFPNPASQNIQIKTDDISLEGSNYKLTNLNGKKIKQGKLKSETIDISGLPKGIYMLSLHTNKGIIAEKIVIE